MPLIGNRYIQSTDPGAVGFGYQWVNDSTGLIQERNPSNSAWVPIGFINLPNYGMVPKSGAAMTGPITGLTGWAPLVSPDFQNSATLNGVSLATQTYVQAQIQALSDSISIRLNDAVTSSTAGISVGKNFKVKSVQNQSLAYGSDGSGVLITTVSLPTYSDGTTAVAADCYGFAFMQGFVSYDGVGSPANRKASVIGGTITSAGLPVYADWNNFGPSSWIIWGAVIIAARS